MKRAFIGVMVVLMVLGSGMAVTAAPTTTTDVTVTGVQVYTPQIDEGNGADNGSDIIIAGDTTNNTTINASVTFPDPPKHVNTTRLTINNSTLSSGYVGNVTIWGGNETADTVYGVNDSDTQKLTTITLDSGTTTIILTENITTNGSYTLEFVSNYTDMDGTADTVTLRMDTNATQTYATSQSTTYTRYVVATMETPPQNQTLADQHAMQYLWSEHVNVSHQFEYRWRNFTAAVTFARENVTRVRSMAWGVNTTSLTSVTPSFYNGNNTAVEMLQGPVMQTVHPVVRITAVGQKVTVNNGNIVFGPEQDETAIMNQPFKVSSTTGRLGIDLETTAEGDSVYDTNTSGSYGVADDVVYPNADVGNWSRVFRSNVTADVDAAGGTVEVAVTHDGPAWRNLTFTNYSDTVMEVDLGVDADGWNRVSVSDEATGVALTEMKLGDGKADLAVTSDGKEVVVTVENLTSQKEILVLNATSGEPIDQGVVTNGSFTFEATPHSTQYIELQYGLQLDYGTFLVNPVLTEDRLVRGATETRTISITNEINESYPVNITESADWITLETDAIVLGANETETVTFNLSSTQVAPGTYQAEILVEGHNTTGSTTVYMTVEPALGGGVTLPFFGLVQMETLFVIGAIVVILGVGGLYYYQTRDNGKDVQASTWK